MSIESILMKACFERKQLIIYLLSNHKIWVKIYGVLIKLIDQNVSKSKILHE